ncbi:hypothetical protein [Streptomyces sp. NBC_01198]|uniref:hypothetical protein n=1 Tax=Streptomyces sp. NBC_01198 TaxID=2903769 RepID=UPI002E0E2970|nr:hypothetical protein OG702_15705 [Streptomyces sp. NBC_01198]
MNDRRITIAMLATGVVFLVAGGLWFLLGDDADKGDAALAVGLGFALICFTQAARMLTKRR